jgi:hypothetical protein
MQLFINPTFAALSGTQIHPAFNKCLHITRDLIVPMELVGFSARREKRVHAVLVCCGALSAISATTFISYVEYGGVLLVALNPPANRSDSP